MFRLEKVQLLNIQFLHIDYVVLQDSLIGNDASLKGFKQSLNLGDSAEVNFN